MPLHSRAPILFVSAVLAAAGIARADSVDLELRGNDAVTGTIRPVYDRERFLCTLVAGSKLSASIKGKSSKGPPFRLTLEKDGSDVPEATFTSKKLGGALAPYVAPTSGAYRV